jgi:hypothetical protein
MALPDYAFLVDDKSCSGIDESEKALADMESLVGNVLLVAQDRILYTQQSAGPYSNAPKCQDNSL